MTDQDKLHARSSLPGRLRKNRAAQALVYIGGLGTIACILGILVFLLMEALPLFGAASVKEEVIDATGNHPLLLAMATDSFQIRMLGLDVEGGLWDYSLRDGGSRRLGRLQGLGAEEKIRKAKAVGHHILVETDKERLAVQSFAFEKSYVGTQRRISIELDAVEWWSAGPEALPISAADLAVSEEGGLTIAWQRGSGAVHISRVLVVENAFTLEKEIQKSEDEIKVGLKLSFLHVENGEQRHLVAVDEQGRIHWWMLDEDGATKKQMLDAGLGHVSSVGALQADRSLILANDRGEMRQFFRVPDKQGEKAFRRIRDFPSMGSAITGIVRSSRNKAFLVSSDEGKLGLYYATTGKRDWMGDPDVGRIGSIALSPKGDGILVSGGKGVARLAVDNPHPETSMGSLLGKVWYEDYPEPTYTWQSTGGSDDFESKLSLVPLMFGTIKGTFFSMLLAIPLALLAALYASLFLHPTVKKWVKPAIEIMAAIPSVILGFLCAIYLAPFLESSFGGFLLLPLLVPLFLVMGSLLLSRMPTAVMARLPRGTELLILGAFLLVGALLSFLLGSPLEGWLFAGDAPAWIAQTLEVPYEQRNAIVIAMGMSFAVIPIIFSISEDAISNVPRNLVSGSLALGANRWETAVRVILPTASPGIFSAVMIGLGRAVGETMIVLMAAGNTAIMDWNPFNGFRTLSANIAVEIPEAPHEGTLYRTLFLAAILLFIMTFFLNSIAEVVRQRLRSRYANL